MSTQGLGDVEIMQWPTPALVHAILSGRCVAAEIRASDIGTRAGLFEVQKIGDEFFTFVVDCDKPKACSIVLRGASKVHNLT